MTTNNPEQKAWAVGPYGWGEWCVIVHAPDRAHARILGLRLDPFYEYIEMRAIRLPKLDGKIVTRDLLIECGFPIGEGDEFYTGHSDDIAGYLGECKCELCRLSLAQL